MIRNRTQSIWFTVLSILASALNFLFYPVLARYLSIASFGDVQVGVSFIMQAAALFTSLNLLALFLSAHQSASLKVITKLERIIISISVIASLLVLIFAQPLSLALQLHDASLLYILALIFIVNVPAGTWIGTLQGEGKFVASGVIAVVSSFFKIIVAVVLTSLGFGAFGALLGILAGTLLVIPLVYIVHSSKQLNILNTFRLASKQDMRAVFGDSTTTRLLLVFFILALLSTLDVVLVKIRLSPELAGVFAQLSTVAKIPYFGLIPIATIGFERFIKNTVSVKIYTITFTLVATLGSSALAILNPWVMEVFFKLSPTHYTPLAATLLIVAFASYTISTLLVYGLIARRRIFPVLISLLAWLFIAPIGLTLAPASIESLAATFAACHVSLLVMLTIVAYTRYNKGV